ncbi:hypothetical protein ES703_24416 [subsurface metagenome]
MAETYDKQILESDYDKGRRAILTPAGAIVPATGRAEQKQTEGANFPYYTLNFDKDADESAFWEFIVPDDYDGGTITVNIWYKTTVATGTVVFEVKVLGREEGEIFDAALGAGHSNSADTVPGTAGNIGICAPAAFSPIWAAGDLVILKLMRDVSEDDAAADIQVIMVEVAY